MQREELPSVSHQLNAGPLTHLCGGASDDCPQRVYAGNQAGVVQMDQRTSGVVPEISCMGQWICCLHLLCGGTPKGDRVHQESERASP